MGLKEYVTEFDLPKEWWKNHKSEDNKRHFKKDWHVQLRDAFTSSKPAGIHCSLAVKTNYYVSAGSRKRGSAAAWTGVLKCQQTSESKCSREYFFKVQERPKKHDKTVHVIVTCEYNLRLVRLRFLCSVRAFAYEWKKFVLSCLLLFGVDVT